MSVQRWLRQERAVHMLVAVILTLVILAGCGGNEAPKEPTPTLPVALRCEGWQSWLQEIDPEIEAIVDILNHMVDDPAPSEDTYKYWEATLRDLSDEVKDSNPPPAFAKYAKTVQLAADTGEGAAIDLRDGHLEFRQHDRRILRFLAGEVGVQADERTRAQRDCQSA